MNIIAARDTRLAEHGYPTEQFCRAWMLDQAETYGWLQDRHPNDTSSSTRLSALRKVWRQLSSSQGWGKAATPPLPPPPKGLEATI